jgi:DNA-binding transcriptional regulator YiaG
MARRKTCPVCGSRNVVVEYPGEFAYEHVGLEGLVLRGRGVEVSSCGECGQETTLVHNEQQLLQALGVILLLGPLDMKGEELRYLRSIFGISQATLASEIGLTRRETVAEWESRSRIFSHLHEEIGLRVLLIGLFRRYVIESDHCFLAPEQMVAFARSVAAFAEDSRRLPKGSPGSRAGMARFSVQRLGRAGRWSLDLAAA